MSKTYLLSINFSFFQNQQNLIKKNIEKLNILMDKKIFSNLKYSSNKIYEFPLYEKMEFEVVDFEDCTNNLEDISSNINYLNSNFNCPSPLNMHLQKEKKEVYKEIKNYKTTKDIQRNSCHLMNANVLPNHNRTSFLFSPVKYSMKPSSNKIDNQGHLKNVHSHSIFNNKIPKNVRKRCISFITQNSNKISQKSSHLNISLLNSNLYSSHKYLKNKFKENKKLKKNSNRRIASKSLVNFKNKVKLPKLSELKDIYDPKIDSSFFKIPKSTQHINKSNILIDDIKNHSLTKKKNSINNNIFDIPTQNTVSTFNCENFNSKIQNKKLNNMKDNISIHNIDMNNKSLIYKSLLNESIDHPNQNRPERNSKLFLSKSKILSPNSMNITNPKQSVISQIKKLKQSSKLKERENMNFYKCKNHLEIKINGHQPIKYN